MLKPFYYKLIEANILNVVIIFLSDLIKMLLIANQLLIAM